MTDESMGYVTKFFNNLHFASPTQIILLANYDQWLKNIIENILRIIDIRIEAK